MKILIIGSGGREHAIAWKLAQSAQAKEIFVAPGNAGTALEPHLQNVNIEATDVDTLLTFAKNHDIDLTIVGPEAPLALGIVDLFTSNGLMCFGPTQKAALLESSKTFCKQFLKQHHIPTAHYQTFSDINAALDYVAHQRFPLVIKADGLAQGKGVIIAHSQEQAEATVTDMLENHRFGHAGCRIIIEDFLEGQEMSYIIISDGTHYLRFATSMDHKKRDAGNQGPNTGGMGAFSPATLENSLLDKKIREQVIEPTLQGMKEAGVPYRGFLYAGLMISKTGEPTVLEYNCRLGDPETQPLLMRLQSDLLALCQKTLQGELANDQVQWDPRPALGVVLCANGYPGPYQKGQVIEGLHQPLPQDTKVFHAGTKLVNRHVLTNGGRVLCATALGKTLSEAHQRAYALADAIHWEGAFYREDIGVS